MTYKHDPALKTSDQLWAEIGILGRKVASTRPDLEGLNKQDQRIQTLLQSLPEEYMVIRDAIDGQETLDVDTVLQKLQEKEAQLKIGGEKAMYAKRGRDNDRHRPAKSKSSRRFRRYASGRRRSPEGKCFTCRKEGHLPRNAIIINSLSN